MISYLIHIGLLMVMFTLSSNIDPTMYEILNVHSDDIILDQVLLNSYGFLCFFRFKNSAIKRQLKFIPQSDH